MIRRIAYCGFEVLLKNCSTVQPHPDNKILTKVMKFILSDCKDEQQQIDNTKSPIFDFGRNGCVKVQCLRVLKTYVLNYGKHISGENFQVNFWFLY